MSIITYIQTASEVKASELVKEFPSAKADWEDFRQELMIHAYQQIEKHNPKRGTMKTFVSSVIKNKGISIFRALAKNRMETRENIEVAENAKQNSITDIVDQQYWGVAQMIARGYTRAEICAALNISAYKIRKIIVEIKKGMGYE
jgi:DNA-directed RNA polymerase specialized sigma24 family protein